MNFQEWYLLAIKSVAEGADTLFAAVLGAAFTVLGVYLSNRNNHEALRKQHTHDEATRKKEYELTFRRDVYIEVAEAIYEGMTSIITATHLEMSHKDVFAKFQSKSGALARVHVVATEKTAQKFMDFGKAYAQSVMELSIKRQELISKRDVMLSKKAQIERHNATKNQYIDLMKQMGIGGEIDKQRWDAINRAYEFEEKQCSILANEHDEILKNLRPKHIDLVKSCYSNHRKLQLLLAPLVISIRNELDIPINDDVYTKLLLIEGPYTDEQIDKLFSAGDPQPNTNA